MDDDEVVRIYLNEEVKNVQKVLINMKVDKMSIVNNCNIKTIMGLNNKNI